MGTIFMILITTSKFESIFYIFSKRLVLKEPEWILTELAAYETHLHTWGGVAKKWENGNEVL